MTNTSFHELRCVNGRCRSWGDRSGGRSDGVVEYDFFSTQLAVYKIESRGCKRRRRKTREVITVLRTENRRAVMVEGQKNLNYLEDETTGQLTGIEPSLDRFFFFEEPLDWLALDRLGAELKNDAVEESSIMKQGAHEYGEMAYWFKVTRSSSLIFEKVSKFKRTTEHRHADYSQPSLTSSSRIAILRKFEMSR